MFESIIKIVSSKLATITSDKYKFTCIPGSAEDLDESTELFDTVKDAIEAYLKTGKEEDVKLITLAVDVENHTYDIKYAEASTVTYLTNTFINTNDDNIDIYQLMVDFGVFRTIKTHAVNVSLESDQSLEPLTMLYNNPNVLFFKDSEAAFLADALSSYKHMTGLLNALGIKPSIAAPLDTNE